MYATRSVNLGTLLNLPVPVAPIGKRNAFYFAYFHLTLVVFFVYLYFLAILHIDSLHKFVLPNRWQKKGGLSIYRVDLT